METEIDEDRGQKVGTRIRLSGRVFGVELSVEEIVVERNPPRRKIWGTTGAPKLLVIGHYRMGFELSLQGNGSMLRVFKNYRAGLLWRLMRKCPYLVTGLRRAGFTGGWL